LCNSHHATAHCNVSYAAWAAQQIRDGYMHPDAADEIRSGAIYAARSPASTTAAVTSQRDDRMAGAVAGGVIRARLGCPR
jgi:hypothetical protein